MSKNPRTVEYEVGYGRPPQEHRFQKGRSGNPKGRPKGALNVKDMLLRRLLTRVNVRENGQPRRISSLEALTVKALNDAIQGRPKAFIEIFKLFHATGLFNLEELDEPPFRAYVVDSKVTFVHAERRPGDPGYKPSLEND